MQVHNDLDSIIHQQCQKNLNYQAEKKKICTSGADHNKGNGCIQKNGHTILSMFIVVLCVKVSAHE